MIFAEGEGQQLLSSLTAELCLRLAGRLRVGPGPAFVSQRVHCAQLLFRSPIAFLHNCALRRLR